MATRLTLIRLYAIGAALDSALAGEGFNGGDFEGLERTEFERAREWVDEQVARREARKPEKFE